VTTPAAKVAFLGLGRMGSGIARNIQKAGFELVVYNRTPEKTKPFLAAGASAAQTPREAAADADFVITMLMDDRSILDVVEGPDGILAGMRPDSIHIGTTTASPSLAARLVKLHGEHGNHYLCAPVAGRPDWAESGKLLTFVAGKPEIIERCRPVLKAYTQEIMVMGEDPAVAASVKLVGNFFVASLIEALGQTLVFAEKRGVNPEVIANMFKAMVPNPGLAQYVEKIRTRDFKSDAGFSLEGGLKDLQLMLDAAADVHMPLPYANVIRDHCLIALAHGMSGSDWSSFTEAIRIDAGQA
jgi:3-hydroxyisobutyrate dehydrogenase-like beta-hydroxyacid dehydrogenase